MALVGENLIDRSDDLVLDRSGCVVGKGNTVGRDFEFGKPIEAPFFVGNEAMDLLAEPGVDRVRRPWDRLFSFLVRNDVHQHQTGFGRVFGLGEHECVEGDLAAESIETLVGVEIVEIDGEVEAFDFVDPGRTAVVKDHAVGAARDLDRPTVKLELHNGRDLTLKTGFGGLEFALQPAMKLGAYPEAGKPTPRKTDGALGRFAEKVADTGPDGLTFSVDDDGHELRRLRSTARMTRIETASTAAME